MPTARTTPPEVTTLRLGDVEITRVVEFSEVSPMTTDVFFPGSTPEEWQRHAALLDPDHWDARTDLTRVATQSWVLRSEGRVVVIDTGAGNGGSAVTATDLVDLDTGYLDNLAAAGVRPEDVDLVVNTHLHDDHVGWNTRLVGRAWAPTRPEAHRMPEKLFPQWAVWSRWRTGSRPSHSDSGDRPLTATATLLGRRAIRSRGRRPFGCGR
ncbi:hypothetical protein SALBM217S_07385 [Streptomyces griseoloalbus]